MCPSIRDLKSKVIPHMSELKKLQCLASRVGVYINLASTVKKGKPPEIVTFSFSVVYLIISPDLGNFAAWPKALGSSPLHPLGRVEVPNRL